MQTRLLKSILFALILLTSVNLEVISQKAPVKFGKLDIADLKMESYPADTGAVAAILCDYGYYSATNFNFIRVLRIKILKKDGTKWGNQIFPTSSKTDIRGITYNLENGEIVETKLKSESIYVERVTEDIYRTRIAMPNVKEGSVIDLEFRSPYLPSEWRFQNVIPVRWSELIIESSPYINFRKNFFGFVPLSESSSIRWMGKDMPAFKEEPFMNNRTNYMTKYEIEVLSINIPPRSGYMGFYKEYCTTWSAVNDRLNSSDYFGMAMQGCGFLNSIAKSIEQKYKDPLDKVKAAQEAVRQAIKWNEDEALLISGDNLNQAFSDKIGNSADVNLILIQLLKKLDLKVYPVALSTRDNGFLSPVFPSLDKLNYVVAYVEVNDQFYLVDATEEFLPVGLLPERCINLQGRVINEDEGVWVDLLPQKKDKRMIQYELDLDKDLALKGKLTRSDYDYAALKFRQEYSEFNSSDEYLTDLEKEIQGLSIENFEMQNLDSLYQPVQEIYEVRLRNQATRAGDQVYLYPLFSEKMKENPFKSEERLYPVDFIYPREVTLIAKINLPDGAEVVEVPKPAILKLPDNSVSMVYQVTAMGNTLNVSYIFKITKPYYTIEEYADLRMFFSEMIKKHSEPIILKSL